VKKFLVVDDEPIVRAFLRKALERSGGSVTEAADGREGLRRYEADRPDCVITDLAMPEKEGIETIMEMRRHPHKARIIAMSGGFETHTGPFLQAARLLGADAVLTKPFTIEHLFDVIRPAEPAAAGAPRHLPGTSGE